jgi:hypothetical protein
MKFSNLLNEAYNSIIAYHGSPYNFDQFDINKVGSSEQGDKYGYGLYFALDKELAIWYAKDSTLKFHEDGLNLYEVKLIQPNLEHWDNFISHRLYENVISKLEDLNLEEDIEEFKENQMEGGYDIWTGRELYEWLEYTVEGKKGASNFLKDLDVDGFMVESDPRGKIVTIFNDEIIKIIDKNKIK